MLEKTIRVLALTAAWMPAAFESVLSFNGTNNNLGGNAMGDFLQADDFTLLATSNITSIVFYSLEGTGAYLGSVDWAIYTNVGNQPGALVSGGSGSATPTRVSLGPVAALGLDAFQNTMSVSVTGLVAATYWLVLHNGPVATTAFSDFYWAWTDLNGGNTGSTRGLEQSLFPASITWDDNSSEHAFSILGDTDVPEPGTMILLSAGLAALWLRRKCV